jgi:hypothetical protein
MTSGPTDYPSNWPGARTQPAAPAPPSEAVALAVDAYIAALTQPEFDQLVSRTRG